MSALDKGSALAALAADLGTGGAHTPGAGEDAGLGDLFADFEAETDLIAGAIAPPRKAGRPPGSPNRTTLQLQKLLRAKGYRDPAEFLAALLTMGTRELAARLAGFEDVRLVTFDQALEVAKLQVRASEGLLPYFHQKMPLAVQHTGDGARPLIMIVEGAAGRARVAGDGALSIHDVEGNQKLGASGAPLSHDGLSHGVRQAADVPHETKD